MLADWSNRFPFQQNIQCPGISVIELSGNLEISSSMAHSNRQSHDFRFIFVASNTCLIIIKEKNIFKDVSSLAVVKIDYKIT